MTDENQSGQACMSKEVKIVSEALLIMLREESQ